jgi:hypothetical protein
MSEKDQATRNEAEQEFQRIVDASPADYLAAAQLGLLYLAANQESLAMPILRNVLDHADSATANRVRMTFKLPLVLEETQPGERRPGDSDVVSSDNPRLLGERSYTAGFFKDARRYFLEAHEQDPIDASIALKLGWTNNLLHDDSSAIHWFDIARQSTDPAISAEAAKAFDNLRPGVARFRTTLWVYPLFSSRWHDLFGYGQLKTELRMKKFPLHPYASLRFDGDVKDSTSASPQGLSLSSFILAVGVATQSWHGATGWFEAGTSMSYLDGTRSADYRGGVSYSRTIGTSIAAEHSGWFVETLADSVFVSHFDNDLLNYTQSRVGFTSSLGAFKVQTFWSDNLTFDVKSQYWANFVETGPGFRFHPPGSPPSLAITIGGVRGVYLRNEDNPRRPNYFDFRAGIWYAITK